MYEPVLTSELFFCDSGLKLCSIAAEFFCVFDKVECLLSSLAFVEFLKFPLNYSCPSYNSLR